MNTFVFREHRVRYRDEGRGIPMILLHNGGNDHRIWDYQSSLFGTSHRIIAPDHPGYGQSDKPLVNYSLHFYADYIRSFIEHLGASRPVLVGNCIGSAMALQYALENPGKVRALVLFNLATEQTLLHGVFGYMYRMVQKSPRIRNVFAQVADIKAFSRMVRMMGFRILYGKTGDPDESFRDHLLTLYSGLEQMPVLYNLLSNFASFRKLDTAGRPADFPPCCMIWGRQNHILSAPHGEEYAMRFGADDCFMVDECGHMVMREKHEGVNHVMSDFLFRNGAYYRASE